MRVRARVYRDGAVKFVSRKKRSALLNASGFPLFFVLNIGIQLFTGAGRGEPLLIDVIDKALEKEGGDMNGVAFL